VAFATLTVVVFTTPDLSVNLTARRQEDVFSCDISPPRTGQIKRVSERKVEMARAESLQEEADTYSLI
jgi:hypothetical protein